MNPAAIRVFALLVLPTILLVWTGCGGVYVTGSDYTPVYGDYGYVGPWDSGRVDVERSYFVAPPYGRPEEDRRREDSRLRQAVAPERSHTPERQAPVQRAASAPREATRPIPSIPNHSRPAAQRNDKDKDQH